MLFKSVIMSSVTICLNMIVKNEERVIRRLLDSVVGVIDSFCICDTGSTDNTVAIVEAFAKESGIKGTIFSEPFVDFGTTRNVSLNEAKKVSDATYLLFLDADMVLEVSPSFDKNSLLAFDQILLKQGTKGQYEYDNTRIVRRAHTFRYVGATHEYVDLQNPCRKGSLDTLFIRDIGDGGSKADKFERDIRLLSKSNEDEPNNPRTLFYLANSYYDHKDFEKAIEMYDKRINLGCWDEEVYYSMYRTALCYRGLDKKDLFAAHALRAWMYRPSRIESVYALMKSLHAEKKHSEVVKLYGLVKDCPVPKDSLFVETSVYRAAVHDVFTLSAYYAKVTKGVAPAFRHLFENADPYHQFGNYKFYVPHPLGFVNEFMCSVPNLTDQAVTLYGSSPSILPREGDSYLMNVRLVNYTIRRDGSYVMPKNIVETENKRLVLNTAFEVVEEKLLPSLDQTNTLRIRGIEDIKLFRHGGKVKFTGTRYVNFDGRERILVCIGTYDESGYHDIVNMEPMQDCEKNWVVIPDNGHDLRMVYKWSPLTVGTVQGNKLLTKELDFKVPKLFWLARGSTNGVQYQGEYWFVVHFVHKYRDEKRFYYHSIVVFTPEMKPLRYTLPFKLAEDSIEYCLGLVVEDGRILISFSEEDHSSCLGVYPHEAFEFVEI